MLIIPYFPSKESSILGSFLIVFSLETLKGRLLKTFMSQCNGDTTALEIDPEFYYC